MRRWALASALLALPISARRRATCARLRVTPDDVKTYLHLLGQPNGQRYEGGPLAGLAHTGWSLGRER